MLLAAVRKNENLVHRPDKRATDAGISISFETGKPGLHAGGTIAVPELLIGVPETGPVACKNVAVYIESRKSGLDIARPSFGIVVYSAGVALQVPPKDSSRVVFLQLHQRCGPEIIRLEGAKRNRECHLDQHFAESDKRRDIVIVFVVHIDGRDGREENTGKLGKVRLQVCSVEGIVVRLINRLYCREVEYPSFGGCS